MQKFLIFLSMGFELTGLIVASLYISPYLESLFAWKEGMGFVLLILLSLVAWIFRIIILIQRIQKTEE